MTINDKLNDKNLLSVFSMVIQTGAGDLLEFPERKDSLQNDWQDENGLEIDLDSPKFKDKETTLKCAILADDRADFWTYHNLLFAELSLPGYQNLYVADHDKTYQVFYKKSGNFKITTKRLNDVPKILVKFDLTFGVKIQ